MNANKIKKIINEKLNSIKEEKEKQAAVEEKIDENLNLEKIEEKEILEIYKYILSFFDKDSICQLSIINNQVCSKFEY